MKKLSIQLMLVLVVSLFAQATLAVITGVTVSPVSTTLNASGASTVPLSWMISIDAGGTGGATSTSAQLINTSTGALLGTTGGMLSVAGGSTGIVTRFESLSISAAQLTSWQTSGITMVQVRRTFTEASTGASVVANSNLVVPAAGPTFTDLSVSPATTTLSNSAMNSVLLTWTATTGGAGTTGITSAQAQLINPTDGSVLGNAGGMISIAAGATGNVNRSDTIVISSGQLSSWQASGLTNVQVRRTFTEASSGVNFTRSANLIVPLAPTDFSAARVSPFQRQITGTQENAFTLNWQVIAEPGHSSGISSANIRVINPTSGATLTVIAQPLSATGSGPFVFTDAVSLSANDVQTWMNAGLNRVVLERSFNDPASSNSINASMVLMLSRSQLLAARQSVTGSLSIQGLRLEFETGNNQALVAIDQTPKTTLTIIHSGTGLLEGRWQIAEPGSTDGQPLYRTLALVRQNLSSRQRSVLTGPELPTGRSGKYLLRFCITNREFVDENLIVDSQCPVETLVASGSYQVQGQALNRVGSILGLLPNQQAVNDKTPFSWQAVSGATIYQLQLFTLGAADTDLPSSKKVSEIVEPRFVTGMILPSGTNSITLSELVRSKLQANHRYMWRVTAHDASGRLIASSDEPSFTYQPK